MLMRYQFVKQNYQGVWHLHPIYNTFETKYSVCDQLLDMNACSVSAKAQQPVCERCAQIVLLEKLQ